MPFNATFSDYYDVRDSTRHVLYGIDALYGMLDANTYPSKYALAGMYKDTHTVSGVEFTNNGNGSISIAGRATAKVTERLTNEPIVLPANGYCNRVHSVQNPSWPDNVNYWFLPFFAFTANISGETNTIYPTIVWHITLSTDNEAQGNELTYDVNTYARHSFEYVFNLNSLAGELSGAKLTGLVTEVSYDVDVTINKNVNANKTVDVGIYTPNLSDTALAAFVKAYSETGLGSIMNSCVYPTLALREDYSRLKCALSNMMGFDIGQTSQTEDGFDYTKYTGDPGVE